MAEDYLSVGQEVEAKAALKTLQRCAQRGEHGEKIKTVLASEDHKIDKFANQTKRQSSINDFF